MLFMTLAMAFAFGCAGIQEDAKVRCPKCGAVFTVDEGIEGVRRGLPRQ
jgi:hypothetical protein